MNTKRKDLSLCDKLKVLEAVKNRKTQTEIAKQFEISQTQVSNIKKNADKIEEEWRKNGSLDRKRKRKSNFDDVDQAVLEWFHAKRSKGALINGTMIMQKAEEISKNSGNNQNFSASKGWLYRFQQRNNLKFKTLHGESGSVDDSVCDEWIREILDPILIEYKPENIFNCDETSLLYRAMPTGTIAQKDEKVHGFKKSKDRVTVLLCVNQTGEDKLQPLFIGKSKMPRCLKNVKNYPISYTYSKNSWMTKNIFTDWLTKLDLNMKKQNRKIVLFMDNVGSHKTENSSRLTNVRIEFLPANTTAKIQPLDQGIIRSFKALYRREIINELLHIMDLETEKDNETFFCLSRKINLLTAMHFCKKAWNNVPYSVIRNSFKKAKFLKPNSDENDASDTEIKIYDGQEFQEEDFEKLKITQKELLEFIELEESDEDENNETDEISSACIGEDDNDEDVINPPPSMNEVLKSIEIIRRHFEARGGDYNVLYNLENELHKCSKNVFNKQTTIMDFFKKP